MKKTVSWSSETLQKEREIEKAVVAAASEKSIPKSKSASMEKQPTAPAVNSRIQQMIAMQKAQNATMRALMDTAGGTGESPSGLRDLVAKADIVRSTAKGAEFKPVPEEVRGVAEREMQQQVHKEAVTHKTEALKPPAITRKNCNESESTSRADGGIHYQTSHRARNHAVQPPTNTSPHDSLLPGDPPTNPYTHKNLHQNLTMSTPPHLNPKLPRFSSDSSSCDSPISYNSVLDHNSTPGAVRERKRMQQQLQTIASQEQMMQQYNEEDANDDAKLRIEPQNEKKREEYDWESIVTGGRGYGAPTVPHWSQPQRRCYTYGATSQYNRSGLAGNSTEQYTPRTSLPQPKQHDLGERESLIPPSLTHNVHAEITQHANPAHTQHLFHYGRESRSGPPSSVDFQSEYDYHSAYHGGDYHATQRRPRRRRRSIWWYLFCYPFKCLHGNEQVGRSFCFGAIDGMLTGAGILAACVGLGLLPHRGRWMNSPIGSEETMHTEWILIALTLAACFSDGICMAVGHVWSTRLVAGSTYEERKEELRNFETSRSDAKARLVDSLLSKGMLKIDAMSLADTLEGYPDMFVSALLGEGICGQGTHTGMSGLGSGGGGSGSLVRVPSTTSASSQQQQRQVVRTMNNAWNIPPPSYAPGQMGHGLKYESYSDFSDYQQDPELKTFTDTVSDSQLEGFFMMLSFSLGSVVPILIYSFLPGVVNYVSATPDEHNILRLDHPPENTTLMMISLGVTMVVMFLLGAWKSHFYSSHWCLFGVETVGILLLCIAAAYFVGWGCGALINSHFN